MGTTDNLTVCLEWRGRIRIVLPNLDCKKTIARRQ